MSEDYSIHHLPNGIRLLFLRTGKFKTISMGFFIHCNLDQDTAALNALLPSVLEQGCRLYPDNLTLQRKLENLFGAELSTDIIKSGERHIVAFGLEAAHGRFTGQNGRLLTESMAILGNVIKDPLLEDGTFRQNYVKQEKNQLIKDIKAILNDKSAYAVEKCLSAMCADEKYGVYKLGRIEDYGKISAADLFKHYRDLMTTKPVDLYVIGDLDEKEVLRAANEAFSFSRSEKTCSLLPAEVDHPVNEVRIMEEMMTVNQAKMVLGFRTYIPYNDKLFCALQVYSGVLGGFPHSKLFMKVREEAGLAYYIHTRLERHKGLMLISAGINAADRQSVHGIIEAQMNEMLNGKITDAELENTKRGLVNQLLSRQDNPSQLIAFHLDGVVGGMDYSFDQLIRGIEATDIDQIKAVAKRITLDTAYLLKPREGEVVRDDN